MSFEPGDKHDDMVDAMRYTVERAVDQPALLAMVATTGIDMGLKRGQQALTALGVLGIGSTALAARMPLGGWFVTTVLLVGILGANLWLWYRRWGQQSIAHQLLERYGSARFRAAQPVVDAANRILNEV